jgi:hypothetical protein
MDLRLACDRRVRLSSASSLFIERQNDDLDPVILEALRELQDKLTADELLDAAFYFHAELLLCARATAPLRASIPALPAASSVSVRTAALAPTPPFS